MILASCTELPFPRVILLPSGDTGNSLVLDGPLYSRILLYKVPTHICSFLPVARGRTNVDKGASPATTSQALMEKAPQRSTNMRWLILSIMCLMYLITYIDRACISVVAPAISKEFGFSKTQMGIIFSAFAWAYALGQIPGGWLGDRFGPRKVLSTLVVFWSVMTAMTARAFGFTSFVAIRVVFGLGEAGAFPTSTRAAQHWYPKSERGVVSAVMHSSGLVAVSLVPPLVVAIMQAWGWRATFYLFGMLGLLWTIIYYLVYRDLPEEHKGVNQAELAHIRGRSASNAINKINEAFQRPRVPWRLILRSPNTWFLSIGSGCFQYSMYFFVYWLPSYLVDHHHVSIRNMGVLASLPLLAGVVGGVTGGVVSDWMYKKTGNLRNARRIVCVVSMMGSAVLLVPSALFAKPTVVVWCMSGSLFFLSMVLGPAWAVAMDIGKQYSGSVSAVMNTVGSGFGAISPIVFGFLTQRDMWIAPFVIATGVLVAGAFVWGLLVNPEKPVVERSAPEVQSGFAEVIPG
jgi:sugar phosphate permease